ncbi:GNAT family N-acetyltransferase [Chryseobacterium lactis]|uniref:GNAT family N-acetyltransferase n=1 Tax=Chryseobacterium lactis TaxID=1241981 RepID=A0A3G6RM66_CHRLC|nr:GNAT family N-acetyltransferase [Chryseobacterium lactis]AZA82565.1 GNAT family N-acetyltransferase [Chryseobacterium lactis]AZB02946.1 GNAT family N-acetyltransferase [Chryseobacterium lactis]PNW13759.1 GNAT family N-acetyltransferase [Chryseobacterium lactis]
MPHQIRLATAEDYPRIMEIWESAVQATHDFLAEEDFNYFKEAIPRDYLPNLEVYLITENNDAKGFASVAEGNLEMLFIHNDMRGKGYGKELYLFMKEQTGLTKVDVNEQNPQAIGFYEKMGFTKVGRSEKDGSGKDYPLIHMSL